MENQEKEIPVKKISRSGLSFTIFCIVVGWLLDVLSTYVGMGIKKVIPGGYFYLFESSSIFLLFPAAWMIALISLSFFIYLFPKGGFYIKGWLLLCIIGLSFLPSIRNTALILGVVFP
jgi:hypothetical protein